jgi:hypothetical protein
MALYRRLLILGNPASPAHTCAITVELERRVATTGTCSFFEAIKPESDSSGLFEVPMSPIMLKHRIDRDCSVTRRTKNAGQRAEISPLIEDF